MEPKNVLGVLAGRDLAPGALKAWLAWADLVVAADGGADLCREAGREPDKIVGDLDSIADATGLTPDEDQNSSDADKLLAYLHQRGIHCVTLIGVEGDRLDHVLTTLYSCVARSFICELVLRTGSAHVLSAPAFVGRPAQGRISLIPLSRCVASMKGVLWPLNHAVLQPGGLVSLSNEMVEERLSVIVHEGSAALFLSSGAWPPGHSETHASRTDKL